MYDYFAIVTTKNLFTKWLRNALLYKFYFNPLVRNSADFFSLRASGKYVHRVKKYVYSSHIHSFSLGIFRTVSKALFTHIITKEACRPVLTTYVLPIAYFFQRQKWLVHSVNFCQIAFTFKCINIIKYSFVFYAQILKTHCSETMFVD